MRQNHRPSGVRSARLSRGPRRLTVRVAAITGRSADPMLRQQSLAIAEAYLEEITLQAFPASTTCAASTTPK